MVLRTAICRLLLLAVFSGHSLWGASLTFERDVRPILRIHCFHCHGEEKKPKGGLDLRLRRLIVEGGKSGPGLVSGAPDNSPLLQRLVSGEMPPEEVKHRPMQAEIATIRRWIEQGAKTARAEPESLEGFYITEEEREFWSFQPIRRPELPELKANHEIRSPIDVLLAADLEKKDLTFAPRAARRSLIRRAYLDLTGLQPTAQEVDAFVADTRPDAWDRVVDRLLDSPRYGERWGRHWLDIAGYADSEGYDDDAVRPYAWNYRDYVIRSLNADKPLDRFFQEQLAGDELAALSGEDPRELLIATGFLRMAPDETGGRRKNTAIARNLVVADTLKIVSTSLLGLSMECAQCHDHKFDPISQADYYRLRAVFEPALNWQKWQTPKTRVASLWTAAEREAALRKSAELEQQAKAIQAEWAVINQKHYERVLEETLAAFDPPLRAKLREVRAIDPKKWTEEQKELMARYPSFRGLTAGRVYLYDQDIRTEKSEYDARAKAIRAGKPIEPFARVLTEPADEKPPVSQVFHRGSHEALEEVVKPGPLTLFAELADAEIPENSSALKTTGRRLAYANWLTSGRHPLVTRVFANRIWMHHFGRGLVTTPANFGAQGARPTHAELLDWLAAEIVAQGWSLKRLHRLIMTSAVYCQSSVAKAPALTSDPENVLYSRMPIRRLEAEAIRDNALWVSGRLEARMFGRPVAVKKDKDGRAVLNPASDQSADRRSIYLQVRRSQPLGLLTQFDAPAMESEPNCQLRSVSTIAPQSLTLMNGDFMVQNAMEIATSAADRKSMADRVDAIWQRIFSRRPNVQERTDALAFLKSQSARFLAHPVVDRPWEQSASNPDTVQIPVQLQAIRDTLARLQDQTASAQEAADYWATVSFAQALLGSNQFIYVD